MTPLTLVGSGMPAAATPDHHAILGGDAPCGGGVAGVAIRTFDAGRANRPADVADNPPDHLTDTGGLNEQLIRDLEKLHREEAKLLHERDELVSWLRGRGQTWVALSSRTKLSRQALMKRGVIPH